jgi:hypothetical protein
MQEPSELFTHASGEVVNGLLEDSLPGWSGTRGASGNNLAT